MPGTFLFVAEAVDGIGGGGFDGLEADRKHCDAYDEDTRKQKDPELYRCAVGKVLKPSPRHKPGDRPGDYIGQCDPLDEFLGKQHEYPLNG